MLWENTKLIVIFDGSHYEVSVIVLVVVAVSFVVFLFALSQFVRWRTASKATVCRWRRARHGDRPPFQKWRCSVCAADAFSIGRQAPKECKKMLKSGL